VDYQSGTRGHDSTIPALTRAFSHLKLKSREVSLMGNERWEQQLREGAARAEEEVRRVVTYINDEVVPEIRVNGSHALRAAAAELQKLAERMDQRRAASAGAAPPPEKDKP
jgi:hypothetical protein